MKYTVDLSQGDREDPPLLPSKLGGGSSGFLGCQRRAASSSARLPTTRMRLRFARAEQ